MSSLRSRPARGFTQTELLVVLVLVSILAVISIGSWRSRLAAERGIAAAAQLRRVWIAERSYYSFHSLYASAWQDLQIPDPNIEDPNYNYAVVTQDAGFTATATVAGGSTGLKIDQTGAITQF